MKAVFEHIERMKEKPHHVRKQVAFSVAALMSACIAFLWLVASTMTGAFAITGSSFADSTNQTTELVTTDANGTPQGLAGAAAAYDDDEGPARIEIVDTTAPKAPAKPTDQTILPF